MNFDRMFRIRIDNIVLTCLVLFTYYYKQVFSIRNEVFEYSQPSECKNNEYFDMTLLSCVKCDTTKNLEPSIDRSRCVCNKFSKTVDLKNGIPLCIACDRNSIVTMDGKDCIKCQNTICKCSENEIQVERDLNGTLLNIIQCLPCSKNSYPSLDHSKCLPCNNQTYNNNSMHCPCPIMSHIRVQNYCLSRDDLGDWLDVRNTYLVKFQSQSIDSYYFRSELQVTMYLCKKKDKLACEHLSNMCALTLFDNGIPCMLFMQKHMSPLSLLYNKEENLMILNSRRISERYSLIKDRNNSMLNFTLTTISLTGEFQTINRSKIFCHSLQNIRFGVNLNKRCKVSVKELLNAEMEFLSPYLIFNENEKYYLYALPVQIKHIHQEDIDLSQMQLGRKFFLVDNISGFKALPSFTNTRFTKSTNLSALRYLSSLSILINIQDGEDRGKIFPPLFIAEYAELTQEQLSQDLEVTVKYKVIFKLKDSHIGADIQIMVGILTGLAVIFSIIKTWSYSKRDYNNVLNITVLFWFIIYTMNIIGNVLIFSSIVFCIYLFIFYKGQTVPYILPPIDIDEKNVCIFTTIAFAFKFVAILGFIYQQWNINVFFIDWEQHRTVAAQFKYDSPRTSLKKAYAKKFSEKEDKILKTPSEIIAAKRKRMRTSNKRNNSNQTFESPMTDNHEQELQTIYSIKDFSLRTISEYESHSLPVSIWRTYFIANEWLELQTMRRISLSLQSICTIFVLQILGLHSWTLAVPELIINKEISDVKKSFTLIYAVCTSVYILVYFIQWLVSVVFCDRYIRNKLQEFVDVCSVANISVFILMFNYYGFYIHGRSVHGFADTDLLTLINDLEKEESELCAHRGLVPGTTEQTFIISITPTFRDAYDDFSRQRINEHSKFLRKSIHKFPNQKEILYAQTKLKEFLCQFLDHCFKNEDYVIKEQHFIEKLCDITLEDNKEKSVFYIDNNNSFERATFYGNEWMFATFELTTFAFILTVQEDYILASIIVILLSQLIMIIFRFNGKKNLSNKSLLDERFLM